MLDRSPEQAVAPGIIVAIGLAAAVVIAALMAVAPARGVGATLALPILLVIALDLGAGLALSVAMLFLAGIPALWAGPNILPVAVLVAWLGTLVRRRPQVARAVREHRKMLGLLALLFVWLALSLAWAPNTGLATPTLILWVLGGLMFLVVAMVGSTRRTALLVCAAFVAGAVAAAAYGLIRTGLTPTASAASSTAEGRLGVNAQGDPNYFAAMLAPAIALAIGLRAWARTVARRMLLSLAMTLLTVALVATQSRGGLVAAAVALCAALLLLRGRRIPVLVAATPIIAVGALWFALNPSALQRVMQSDGGGAGRTEHWDLALRMAADRPLVGVGLNQYQVKAGDYVREPRELKFADQIAQGGAVPHNVYLQLLAETGIIGLALFLAIAAACLHAAWRAVTVSERADDRPLADLARAALVAMIATLTASFFLSNGGDRLLWVLLALGPALLVVAGSAQHGGRRDTLAG